LHLTYSGGDFFGGIKLLGYFVPRWSHFLIYLNSLKTNKRINPASNPKTNLKTLS